MDASVWCVFAAFLLIYLTRLPVLVAIVRKRLRLTDMSLRITP